MSDLQEVGMVTDMPVEVSMVTEVSSESVLLPNNDQTNADKTSDDPPEMTSEELVLSHMELPTGADNILRETQGLNQETDKGVAMETVQYAISEVVTSDSIATDLTSDPSKAPSITVAELISPAEKETIVSFAEMHSIPQASSKFKVPSATIRKWLKDRDGPGKLMFNSPGQGRKLSYSTEKDEDIAKHVKELLARGEKVTLQYICQYAKNLIQEDNPQFSASTGWGQRFLIRHSIDIGRPKHVPNPKVPENRGRPLSYSAETDKQLADYVRSRISEGQMFTNSELRKHAREVITKESPTFTGSASWAQNFLHRHKISLQSIVHESPEPSSLLNQPTPSLADNPIGPAAEITPATSHQSMYPSHDDTMKTALAILTGDNIDTNTAALQSSLSGIAPESVSLVDLLTSAQQLQDASEDGGVSLITSGLESPSGSIYLNLGGSEGFGGGFSAVDPNTQAPIPTDLIARNLPQHIHDVVAQASRPLSYTKETDQVLAKWVREQQAMGKKVTFASLRAHAKELICQENPNFNASIGWVTPFLLRHNLDLNLNKKKQARKGSVPRKVSGDGSITEEGDDESPSLHTADPPVITPDVLATAIATSLAEHVQSGLPSLADQARLVLTQNGQFAITTDAPQEMLEGTDSNTSTKIDSKPSSPKHSPKRDKSRNRHTLAEKLEVVRLMKEYNVAAHYVCRTLGIANSTYAGWTKLVSQKGAELEALSSNRKRANVKGQGRPLSYSKEIDEAISKWVRAQQQLGVQVTPAELGKYATTLISQESSNFTASSGWQQKFLQRHHLQLHSTWTQKTAPPTPAEDKPVAEDQTTIPTPVQTEEVVANDFKPASLDWPFGTEVDTELAKWVRDKVQEFGSFSVSSVCKKAEELSQNPLFVAKLGWAFKFLHHHGIMLDPKPTISQLCATALNRKRTSSDNTASTPKKLRPSDSQDLSVSPSTGNLCEALLALSNQNTVEGSEATTMQAALQSLQTAVAQVIQQQQLQVEDQVSEQGPLLEPIALIGSDGTSGKESKVDTPNSQTSNTYFGKPAREFSSDEKEEVVRYANATTLQKAALKYGVAAPTVWRWRVELKLHQPKYTSMQKKYIIKFAEANSLREASTRYGISGKTIQNWRKSLMTDGDLGGMEEVPVVTMATGGGITEPMDTSVPPAPHPPSEPTTSEVVTYDTQNFQFIVDGGEVVESNRRPELPPSQNLVSVEPLSLEVTNEVDIENVGMEYDIVSSEGHAAKPRCTPEEKEHILQFALDHSVREASNKYGISQGTLYYWKKNMGNSTGGEQGALTNTSTGPVVQFSMSADSELLLGRTDPVRTNTQSISEQYITTSTSAGLTGLTSEALQNLPSDVSFLNAVSSLLTSAEVDKSKSSQRLHSTSGGISSPTEVLVTPFHSEQHSDVDSTATVTVVTSEVDPSTTTDDCQSVTLANDDGSLQIEEQVVEVREDRENELSMPSTTGDGLETINMEEVAQTVELVDSEEQESRTEGQ